MTESGVKSRNSVVKGLPPCMVSVFSSVKWSWNYVPTDPFLLPPWSRAVGEVTNRKGLWNHSGELELRILRGSVHQPSRGDRALGSSLHKRQQGEKEPGFGELHMEKGRYYRVPESLQKVGPSLSFSWDQGLLWRNLFVFSSSWFSGCSCAKRRK